LTKNIYTNQKLFSSQLVYKEAIYYLLYTFNHNLSTLIVSQWWVW